MPLTDVAIRRAKPSDKNYKLFDGGGLYLLVHTNGSKYWRLKYRHARKEKTLALGIYPQVPLAEAREAREDAKRLIKRGEDPVVVRKIQKHEAEIKAANTFEKVAKQWIENKRNEWTEKHAKRVQDSLERNLFPDLGKRPIADITAPELLMALRKIEKRGAHDYAQRILQRVNMLFRYGIASGICTENPASDLKGALKAPKRGNRAAVHGKELPELLKKIDTCDAKPETRLGLQLLALTFVRPGELRGARWEEFDFDHCEWRIPASRMKMRTEHIVPLSRQSLAVLNELYALTGKSPYLLPSRSNLHKCISENTLTYALHRMGYHSKATAHGFRATASTILNEQGWDPDVIERQLAHVPKNKVRAAYNRAEYLTKRQSLMQAWADHLDQIKSAS
ncbi:integrase [Methylohalomonas lacus]|uniref:Integrase n=1 Tax=Methylohalomonas lacus TaxID=398773 RepID=A0AAE3L3J3_9GAMM|nr:integrase arm-type DNA-binding domain-containing protein [Methylohalomonas lacus]MCS3902213.1 integrase [Methylohalomonas lacus]